ncbi:MAG: DUF4476 domain-containing protein [Chitinophagaceae bacterium]|nr:DUF4476 domain-containing protein [Chitinophagaceae bacterium]
MKRIFTLLIASVFSLSLLAFDGSRVSVSSVATSTEMKIEIDGRKFSMNNNSVTVSYLAEGYHQVKIFREKNRKGNGFGSGRKSEVIFSSSIFLKRGFHLDITVNRFGKVMTDERRIDINDDWYNDEDDYYDTDNGGWNGGRGNVMNNREFSDMKDQIRKEWFENNRLISAKVIIDKNNFNMQQVKELMLLFTFENNRLEVAKYAYRKTVDKQNYYQLNDALTFNSSKDELARFIRESR